MIEVKGRIVVFFPALIFTSTGYLLNVNVSMHPIIIKFIFKTGSDKLDKFNYMTDHSHEPGI